MRACESTQCTEDLRDNGATRRSGILPDGVLLFTDHEIEAVERLVGDVLLDIECIPFDQAELGTLSGELVVLLCQPSPIRRALDDRKKFHRQYIGGFRPEELRYGIVATGQNLLCITHGH